MTWNYRLFKFTENDEEYLEVREVYYNNEGQIMGWTDSGATPLGNNTDEVRSEMGLMLLALDKPILVEGEFEVAKNED